MASTLTKIGIRSRTGQAKIGFRSRAVVRDTQCHRSCTRDQATMLRTTAESMTKLCSIKCSFFVQLCYYFVIRKQRPDFWWNQGCSKALQLLLVRKLHVVGIVAIVIAFLQVNVLIELTEIPFLSQLRKALNGIPLFFSCSAWLSACFCFVP